MGFEGFDRPTQNWFKMPRSWPNITAKLSSLAELKVIEYVLCHTWGFGEYGQPKRITIDEFMHGRKKSDKSRIDEGTGLSERGVQEGLKKAVADGYLIEEVDDSDKGRIKRYFSLKMKPDQDTEGQELEGHNLPPRGQPSRSKGAQSNNRTEKDPLERTSNAEKRKTVRENPTPSSDDPGKYFRGKFGHLVKH